MAHANSEMGNRYAYQLLSNKKFRAEWAAKVSLGFKIPRRTRTQEGVFAIHAIQNQESVVAA